MRLRRNLSRRGVRNARYRGKRNISRKTGRNTRYLIEIRLFGAHKHDIKNVIHDVRRRFKIRAERAVPHITLAGSLTTNDERKLINDFREICIAQGQIMELMLDGYGTFDENKVIKVNAKPDRQLVEFRWALINKLRPYCNLNKPWDDIKDFNPHATIAMRLTDRRFKDIKEYLHKYTSPRSRQCVARVTLLVNRGKSFDDAIILKEYDFFLRKLLSRSEAKDRGILGKTWDRINEYIEDKVQNGANINVRTSSVRKALHRRLFDDISRFFRK